VAQRLGRRFVCIDENPQAVEIMAGRLPDARVVRAV
jgi:site-specific DNA-methyltransferase (adenine-specific)